MGEWIITAQPGAEDEVFEFVDPKSRRTVSLPKKLKKKPSRFHLIIIMKV